MNVGKAAALIVLFIALGAGIGRAQSIPAQVTEACAGGRDGIRGMIETEYAFSRLAQSSVRDAFLRYLASDAVVLAPGPTPGRAFYEASKPDNSRLEWYPAVATIADSGDFGFTSGPWISTGASGVHAYGHFVTIWKRDARCQWRAEFDGGISHAMPDTAEPKLPAAPVPTAKAKLPPQQLIAQNAPDAAIREFQQTALQNGLPAGLRTYAQDNDFRFYVDGESPMDATAATQFLTPRYAVKSWNETARGRSADATLLYCLGEFTDIKQHTYAYVQIWHYDPKVANWGLRIFLESH